MQKSNNFRFIELNSCALFILFLFVFNASTGKAQDASSMMMMMMAQKEGANKCPIDKNNKGLEDVVKGINDQTTSLKKLVLDYTNYKVDNAVLDYKSAREKCLASQPKATKICLTNSNPGLASAALMISEMFSSAIQGTNDSCKKTSKALGIGTAAVQAYIAACELTKGSCSSACGKSIESTKKVDEAFNTTKCLIKPLSPDPVIAAKDKTEYDACEMQRKEIVAKVSELVKKEIEPDDNCKSVGSIKNACTIDYGTLVTGAGLSLKNMLGAMKKSDSCEESTASTTTPGTTASTTDVDCSKVENASNEKCICLANPRLAGCSSTLSGLNNNSSSRLPSTSSASASGVGDDAIKAGDIGSGVNGIQAIEPSNAAGGGSSLRGGGYGGGAGGLSGGGSAGDPKAAAAGAAPLDTNVLSGEGGGGGMSGSFGGGSAALEKALEEEKKDLEDPNKVAAMEWAKQVAPESGRSNFERVRDRYNATRRTLMQK